ncbi:MAG: MATE family efflux transporter, partial [Gammaproteobacteria bacterium]|nr:MATE family efflux transporter [Gammaproteobacteria bacterium]
MSNRTLKALKGLISSYIHYGITILLQIFLMPVVLKYAGQETLGVYTIIMQIIGYGILFDMGFSVALGRYLARTYGDSKNKNAFSEVFSIGRIFLFVSNIVISLFVILISIYFDEFIHIQSDVLFQSRYALVMLSIWITFRSSFLMYNHGLLATQNMAIVNLIAIISNVIRLLLTVALVMMGYGIIGMIIGNIVSE